MNQQISLPVAVRPEELARKRTLARQEIDALRRVIGAGR